jgi:hypothetical protein
MSMSVFLNRCVSVALRTRRGENEKQKRVHGPYSHIPSLSPSLLRNSFAERVMEFRIGCSRKYMQGSSFFSGLRSLEVAFPPHDSSDAGSNPAEFVGKIQGTSPPGGTLSCLTRVVNLLHVNEPQAPRGPVSKIIGHFPSKSFGRGLAMS